jgi:hypothetical protein
MATLNSSGMGGLTRATEACNRAGVAWQQELARFTTARLQSDGEFGQKLFGAKNWADAVKVQHDWIKTAGQDYLDEANRLVQMAQKIGAEMMHPLDAEAETIARSARGAAE